MSSAIDQLFVLQEVDTRLRNMKLELADLEQAASKVRAEVEAKLPVVQARRLEMAEMERRRREVEARLADDEEKIKDRRMRMQRIRNEKELGALRREVEIMKEQDALLEDELLKLFETGEGRATELKSLEDDLAAEEARLTERERELAERTQALRAEMDQHATERGALAAAIEESLRRRYEMVFERKGGVAVVEVKAGDCTGCRMRVPPQLVTQIHRNQIVSCPNCHRILYHRAG